MPQLGPAEILVILVVALLVFGPKRLPEVGRQVGRGLKELRKLQDTVRDEINDVIHHDSDDEPPSYATAPAPDTPVAGSGRTAPSRFRPAATPALGSGVSAGSAAPAPSSPASATPSGPPPPPWPTDSSRPTPAPTSGTHAPSRFRAPGR